MRAVLYGIVAERDERISRFAKDLQEEDSIQNLKDKFEQAILLYRTFLVLGIRPFTYRFETMGDVFKAWINSSTNQKTQEWRKGFMGFLKHLKGFDPIFLDKPFNPEALNSRLAMFDCYIRNLNIAETSKNSYYSCLNGIDKYIESFLGELWRFFEPGFLDSLKDLADFLEWLEKRALRSTTVRKYNDLLICRALIHAPIPVSQFIALPAPDAHQEIQSNSRSFQVPGTFMKFWKAFGEKNYLLPASVRAWKNVEKRLDTLTSRRGKKAGLSDRLAPGVLSSLGLFAIHC